MIIDQNFDQLCSFTLVFYIKPSKNPRLSRRQDGVFEQFWKFSIIFDIFPNRIVAYFLLTCLLSNFPHNSNNNSNLVLNRRRFIGVPILGGPIVYNSCFVTMVVCNDGYL